MLPTIQDRFLPPDHEAFVAGEPPTGRVIVIAPTRAACETIEIALSLHIETYLERTHGERLRELARSGKGFGIVAGTGTGKTLAIRPIAEEILRGPLKIGVVNREREATPELPNLNAIVVTTGIARRWFQDGDILLHDTLVVDEIHQTSAELELCLALGKRVGCRFIWLSATVDPAFYRAYLNSADVLEVYSFDPKRAAKVELVNKEARDFLDEKFVREAIKSKRGMGLFMPTRAGVEQAANSVRARFPRLNTAFYHGGEPVRAIRPFLEEGGAPKPYLLTMTAAGQSALNVQGLDTVIIDDSRFANVIQRGRNVLTRLYLGSNEILQMAGRVHGRVENGRVFILSDRHIDFANLRPTEPEFQLAGDSERVALTCADLGVRADELDLPVPLDKYAYRRAFSELQTRGIINESGRLTKYGKSIEALPVDRPWAELIVNGDKDLLPCLAVMSSIESLHRMTRDERDLRGLVVSGSDHLTTYNLYAEAFAAAGYMGEVYGLPRHLFDNEAINKWADERGVLVKSIEDAALAMACVLRSVGLPLPETMPLISNRSANRFVDLLAQFMPFDLVIDGHTSDNQEARVSKSSVCGEWGAIAGSLSFFADRNGVPRAFIEGTNLPFNILRRYAKRGVAEFIYDARHPNAPLILKRTTEYFGFVLERQKDPIKQFPAELIPQARRALAEALARFEAQHKDVFKNRDVVDEVRDIYRRSGAQTVKLGFHELAAVYEQKLTAQNVASLMEFRNADLKLHLDDFVPAAEREKWHALPSHATIQEREVEIEYDLEDEDTQPFGIARLKLPEKIARDINENDLPKLDRPLRFIVSRGSRGALRADSLKELQTLLEGPWTPTDKHEHRPAPKEKETVQPNRKPKTEIRKSGPRKFRPRGPKGPKKRR